MKAPRGLAAGIARVAYDRLFVPAAGALLPAASTVSPKAKAFRIARRTWRHDLERALAARPDVAAGDALWVHGASAGEFLQARALLRTLRAAFPQAPLVYTFTSPSAAPLLERFHGADLVVPLPLDTRVNARAWLDVVRPAALALVDAELWPNLLAELGRRGLPAALVSARLDARSRRERFPARALYRELYDGLVLVGAVNEASAQRFADAGVPSERIRVTGDLRVDETLARALETRDLEPFPFSALLPVVVAGSTWPDDEAVLLPGLSALRDRGIYFWLVVAPHEVEEGRLNGLEEAMARWGFTPERWSRRLVDEPAGSSPADELDPAVDALVVDSVGLLHRLYARAAFAFVGGGFHAALHNVMEPLALGVPVLTGPRTGRSWIAPELVRACALFPVADSEAFAAVAEHFLGSPEAAREAGKRGRDALAAHAGAAERTLAALRELGWLRGEPPG